MGEIVRLSDDLINKIAAGEVVERPASVVKELVENALDAGATRIEVELIEGGLELIRVTDNGKGISADDLPLAFERHATSKIKSDGDLFNLHTMGFRGEALASISAVSKFKILSCHRDSNVGCRLAVEGGKDVCVEEWTHPIGTSVVVEDLFYNVPARRNFLKNAHGEYAHVLEWMQALALAQPSIGFKLVHNDRVSLDLESAANPGEEISQETYRRRVVEVLKAQGEGLLSCETANEYCSLKGFFSPPGKDRSHSGSIYVFINDRWIQNKNLRFAILRGYHSHLMKGRFPVAVLYLKLDPSLVDVNVHPAKTEVRLQYITEIQNLIAMSIREKLREGAWSTSTYGDGDASELSPTSLSTSVDTRSGAYTDPLSSSSINSPWLDITADVSRSAARDPLAESPVFPLSYARSFDSNSMTSASEGQGRITPSLPSSFTSGASSRGFASDSLKLRSSRPDANSVESLLLDVDGPRGIQGSSVQIQEKTDAEIFNYSQSELFSHDASQKDSGLPDFDDMKFLGCFSKCFLFFEFNERLLCLDQHAFHERVLYEKLTQEKETLESSQPMLIPEVIELRPTHVAALMARKSVLESLGFSLTQVAPDSIEVSAVPAFLARVNLETTLVSAVANLQSFEAQPQSDQIDAMHHILSTLACHGAVRAGDELTESEIRTLFAQSRQVDFWQNCPHGRPVLKWLQKRDIESWFSR